jgi:DnaJ domain
LKLTSSVDHEIFRLHDDVIAHEGPNATFYSFIGVPRNAKVDEINRAYRSKSRSIHPDKAQQVYIKQYAKDKASKDTGKGSDASKKPARPSNRELSAFMKEAGERFARLGVIANILRGASRDRYDFFLDHGFPKWRGTGYYYQRYRPGVGTVLVGLFVVMGGFAHYSALIVSWKRQRDFAEKYIRDARKLAWGKETVIPGLDTIGTSAIPNGGAGVNANGNGNGNGSTMGMNRKQKRAQEKENRKGTKKAVSTDDISAPVEASLISGPQGSKRRVVAENGKTLIVDSVGNVYLEETTDEGETHEYLIDVCCHL